jgi:CRISPR/Cas system CMR-associated protein Cmr5 small subunit
MKHIQKLIPTAIIAAEELRNKDKNNGYINEINTEFNGYISSFGSSIISAGLLPTIIFFSQKGDSASERHRIIRALEVILKTSYNLDPGFNLLKEVKRIYKTQTINQAEVNRLTDKILDAAIALKLAIRTFEKSKKA